MTWRPDSTFQVMGRLRPGATPWASGPRKEGQFWAARGRARSRKAELRGMVFTVEDFGRGERGGDTYSIIFYQYCTGNDNFICFKHYPNLSVILLIQSTLVVFVRETPS